MKTTVRLNAKILPVIGFLALVMQVIDPSRVWVILLIKGYSGTKWKLPFLGDIAERMAAGQRTA